MAKRKSKAPKAVPLVILTNEQNEQLVFMLRTFYQAFKLGQVGMITGMDANGNVSPMLAGIEMTGDDITGVFPLAKILADVAEIESILIPDGQGNYVSNTAGLTKPDNSTPDGEAEEESGQTVEQGEAEVS